MRGAASKGLHAFSRALVPEPLPAPAPAGALGPLLANRPFLAGSDRPSCPKNLPHVSEEEVDCYRLVEKGSKDEVPSAIASLVQSQLGSKGALLVRGLSPILPTNAHFGRLASLLGQRFHYNAGFASREEDPAAPGVMAAADDPPEVTIEPHLEMSYNLAMPAKIIFYCHQAPGPEEGGQTPVCDMRRVLTTLRERKELKELIEKGVRYYRTLHSRDTEDGALYSWQKTFPSASCAEIEAKLEKLGYSTEWTDQGALRYSYLMSAVRSHPTTGEEVWCNQASVSHGSYYLNLPNPTVKDPKLAPSHTGHADGRELSQVELDLIREGQWSWSRAHSWQPGDLLVLDNQAVAHGRLGFCPSASRRVVVAITK